MNETVRFRFNSSLVQVPEGDGTLQKGAFSDRIKPLRGQLLQLDGVAGCTIERYELIVTYHCEIVSFEAVVDHVKKVISEWAPTREYFPYRGDRVPEAIVLTKPRRRTVNKVVERELRVTFNTDLFAFTPDGTSGWSKERFDAAAANLAEELTKYDGLQSFELLPRMVYFKIPADHDTTVAYEHIYTVLCRFKALAPLVCFPFKPEAENLVFGLKVTDVCKEVYATDED